MLPVSAGGLTFRDNAKVNDAASGTLSSPAGGPTHCRWSEERPRHVWSEEEERRLEEEEEMRRRWRGGEGERKR